MEANTKHTDYNVIRYTRAHDLTYTLVTFRINARASKQTQLHIYIYMYVYVDIYTYIDVYVSFSDRHR